MNPIIMCVNTFTTPTINDIIAFRNTRPCLTPVCDPSGFGSPCPTDFNDDGETSVPDLTTLLVAWGSDDPDADINDDGIVNVQDLAELVVAWGPCP